MRIAIFGTGGVGGFFGGKLAQAGQDVTFIARGAHLDAIRQNGLRVESVMGDFTISPAKAESDPARVGEVDVVIVGVKAWQVREAAEAMRPMIGSRTLVIPLQNGVEAQSEIAAVLGEAHALGGVCAISCFIAAPGVIRHVGIQPRIAFNRIDGSGDPLLSELRDDFTRMGVTAFIPDDIRTEIWHKFIFICPVSGIGAASRAPIGIQRSVPETRKLLEDCMHEVAEVGRKMGVGIRPTIEQETMQTIDGFPVGTVASMARDMIDGKPSELEYQTGSVVRLAKACGVSVPINTYLYRTLLPLEQRARGKISF